MARAATVKEESFNDTPESLGPEGSESEPATPEVVNPYVVYVDSNAKGAVMPDLRGKNMRSVLELCSELGIEVTYQGVGMVVEQSPAPGAPLPANAACRVRLDRRTTARNALRSAIAQGTAAPLRGKLPVRTARQGPSTSGSAVRTDGTIENR